MFQFIRRWLYRRKFLYYIGRHDVLPPPLKNEQEKDALERLVRGDQEARDLLIEHNLRLVVYVAKRYDSVQNGGIEDLISIGTIGLVKAINTFKIDKNIKLATYASRCIENEILMFLRKNNKLRHEISLDEPLNIDYDGNELLLSDIIGTDSDIVAQEIETTDQKEKFYGALTRLSNREREILMLRYGLANYDELTQKDVAKMMGISQSYISRLEKKIIKKLRNKLNDNEIK
ncbi:MAG: RNA polymerase sporulation sigma factor SigK [Coprobacillaceae bacterium]